MEKHIVIIGATSGIAEHCARLWAQKSHKIAFTLVGRNISRLEKVAADLEVRNPTSQIYTVKGEFHDASGIRNTVERILKNGKAHIVLIAHGVLPDQTDCQKNLDLCRLALEINGISPVLYAECFAQHMMKNGGGTIALISSVAGDRGRASNYVYGAAKSLVSRYAQGLQHRFSGTSVKIILVKPGPTETPMTAHLKTQGVKLASTQKVADQIVSGIEKGQSVIYTPKKWGIIMMIIRLLPNFIFNKLKI